MISPGFIKNGLKRNVAFLDTDAAALRCRQRGRTLGTSGIISQQLAQFSLIWKKKQTHIFKSRCEQTRPVHEELRHSEEHRTLLQKLKTLIFLKTRLWVEIILCFWLKSINIFCYRVSSCFCCRDPLCSGTRIHAEPVWLIDQKGWKLYVEKLNMRECDGLLFVTESKIIEWDNFTFSIRICLNLWIFWFWWDVCLFLFLDADINSIKYLKQQKLHTETETWTFILSLRKKK